MSNPKLNLKEETSAKKTRSPPKKAKVEQSVPKKKKLKTDADKAAEKAQHLRFGKAELTPDELSWLSKAQKREMYAAHAARSAVHREVDQYEDDNVGTQALSEGEKAAGNVRDISKRIYARKLKKKAKMQGKKGAKTAKSSPQKPTAAQDTGASCTGEGGSNWLSRWRQKQDIRQSYYATAHSGTAAQTAGGKAVSNGTTAAKSGMEQVIDKGKWCAPPRSRRNSLPPCCASLQLPPRPRLRCPQSVLRSTRRNLIMKMMNKFCALMLSVALCAGMAAPAFAYGGEPVEEVEQPVLTSTTDEEDVVTVTDEETGALTPEGNLTMVDDYHTSYSDGSGQQFITLVSKSGNTFYLVIDRNDKGENTVHFMNLVDEADLLSLMEDEDADAYTAEKEAAAQAEQERKQAEEDAKKAAEEAVASGSEQTGGNKVTKYAATFLGVLALVGLVAGGGIYTFMKQKQKKQAEKEALDPDANYTEDKGDFEIPVEDEPEETGEEDNAEE